MFTHGYDNIVLDSSPYGKGIVYISLAPDACDLLTLDSLTSSDLHLGTLPSHFHTVFQWHHIVVLLVAMVEKTSLTLFGSLHAYTPLEMTRVEAIQSPTPSFSQSASPTQPIGKGTHTPHLRTNPVHNLETPTSARNMKKQYQCNLA
jgi:hypothetical protein